MKALLRRQAIRLLILFYVPAFFASWALAVPFASLGYYERREHFRTFREMIAADSWRSAWRVLKTGSLD